MTANGGIHAISQYAFFQQRLQNGVCVAGSIMARHTHLIIDMIIKPSNH